MAPPEARIREKATGDEEATAELKLGEFQSIPSLTLSEARILINTIMANRRVMKGKVDETEYEIHHSIISCPVLQRTTFRLGFQTGLIVILNKQNPHQNPRLP